MKDKRDPAKKSTVSRYARFSGIAFQMGSTIFLGAYLGRYLDDKYPSNKKWFTIGLTIFAVAVSLYNIVRQLNKINAEDDIKSS